MATVSVTRMELLARKANITLAKQGRDLLEQKRTALMKELFRTADTVLEHTDVLDEAAAHARQALSRAVASAGTEALLSAALATRSELPIQASTTNVMGVKVPTIEQRRLTRQSWQRGYSVVRTSTTIDEAAEAFEVEVEAILQLAEDELRLKRLAAEIQHTSRRLNALDHLVIPRLEAECEMIQMALDERERADHFRLKLVKRTLERKRERETQFA